MVMIKTPPSGGVFVWPIIADNIYIFISSNAQDSSCSIWS